MNPVLAELLETRRVVARDGTVIPLHSEISVAEGTALQQLIRELRPQVTLEIGCGYGVSALFMCEALADVGGRAHIVIDPDQVTGWKSAGLFAIERAGFGSLLEFHPEPSHLALPRLEEAGVRVGVALIDGWHTFDYAMVDFFYVDHLLEPGGVLMLDDTAAYPAIRKLARYIRTHRQYVPLGTRTRLDAAASPFTPSAGRLRRMAERIFHPRLVQSDSALGLPPDNFIAFRKIADDRRGDGSGGTRRWDQHHDF